MNEKKASDRFPIPLLKKLNTKQTLDKKEWQFLIEGDYDRQPLFAYARALCEQHYGKEVYIRGLIEMTSYCKNDCYYCGIRRSNRNASRYRLTEEEILSCADVGYDLGFRTFVLQGGEDFSYSTSDIARIVSNIKKKHPDCAVTLSLGEREKEDYRIWKEAGADRYLLRHETADRAHYEAMHPQEMFFSHRIQCLWDLKELGYQVGCGFMVGSPGQTVTCLIRDMELIRDLKPQMVGIGPFIPHHDTPFRDEKGGTLEMTLTLLALIRIMQPDVLLPATTALGTIHPKGRELGLLAGANVVMPNLSPQAVRKSYELYDNKICTGEEAAECISCLKSRVEGTGKQIVTSRGDAKGFEDPKRM